MVGSSCVWHEGGHGDGTPGCASGTEFGPQGVRERRAVSGDAGAIALGRQFRLPGLRPSRVLLSDAPAGVSMQPLQVELKHRFGVWQMTVWVMKRKIMAVMARREGDKLLSGRVEMDEDYLDGVRSIALPPTRIEPPTTPCAQRLPGRYRLSHLGTLVLPFQILLQGDHA